MKRFISILICCAATGFLFSGCSGKGINDASPQELYDEAQKDIDSSQYLLALEKLRMLKNKFPYSNLAAEAQLKIADVYFLQDSFIEAAAAYEIFNDLHPKHEKTVYALFKIGDSYYNDVPGNIARDLTSATKAEAAFNNFLKKFPAEEKSDEIRNKRTDVRNFLAKKELYIGDFYYREDQYLSAQKRYVKILNLYPDSKFIEEAKKKLKKIESLLEKEKS